MIHFRFKKYYVKENRIAISGFGFLFVMELTYFNRLDGWWVRV